MKSDGKPVLAMDLIFQVREKFELQKNITKAIYGISDLKNLQKMNDKKGNSRRGSIPEMNVEESSAQKMVYESKQIVL